jgi:hypothetical protein
MLIMMVQPAGLDAFFTELEGATAARRSRTCL